MTTSSSHQMRTRVHNMHMLGIGGSGMSGIAEVLLNLGYHVSGSDLSDGPVVQRLKDMGAVIYKGHDRGQVGEADVVVRSTAISAENPELQEAMERGIPIIPRAEMLAELMRLKDGVAVAGTHGKTTTTSLLAAIFEEAGQDPTVIIGGRLNAYGSNARLGEGNYLIAEADESDGSFLCLFPMITIITNVDADHLDFYPGIDAIDAAFVQFMNQVPFYGRNVVCGDDPGVQRLLGQVKRPVLLYGFGLHNRLRAEVLECSDISRFRVLLDGKEVGVVNLRQPGRHNVLNALAAVGVALEAGISMETAFKGLENFTGVGRRFERKGERDGVLVIDDYGHHPAEIRATIETARSCFPQRRLVLAFQPHRFSRTQALFGDFCKVFANVDKLFLTEIYPASEAPIPSVSGQSLAQGIMQISNTDVIYCQDFDAILEQLPATLEPGDIFMTMGAGNIWTVGRDWLAGEGTP